MLKNQEIKFAKKEDLDKINEIYNYYVKNDVCTFQLKEETIEDRIKWFEKHSEDKYPIIIFLEDNKIIGWGSLSKYNVILKLILIYFLIYFLNNLNKL
jgi:L-amino acid N-acyltransferase